MSNTTGVSFVDFQHDLLELKAKEQDLKSALYAIHPFPSADNVEHYVVLFPNLEELEIDYEILDSNMMQIRLLKQVPPPVLIFAMRLYSQILEWSEGKALYPHSFFQFPDVAPEHTLEEQEALNSLDGRDEAADALIAKSMGSPTP